MAKNKLKLAMIFISMLLAVSCPAIGCGYDIFTTADYTLKVIDDSGTVYSDYLTLVGPGIKVNSQKIKIIAEAEQRQYTVMVDRKNNMYKPDADGKFELAPGNNELGVWVFDLKRSDQEPLDITWIRVYYMAPTPPAATIEPSVLEGDTDTSYTFTAKSETEPVVGSYEWKLDGNLLGKGGGAILIKKFPEAGTYKLTVVIYDEFSDEICGQGEATVTIRAK